VFIQDTTGSQQPYIDTSIACCKDVCIALKGSGQLEKGLRLAVVAFRDHFVEDKYVTKDFGGFTTNVDAIVANLSTLVAHGGGDGPEAITAALDKALKLNWREDAVKIAVVITDAPPHGIGERDDDYSDGEPDGMLAPNFCMNGVNLSKGKDPLVVAKAMSKLGIVLVFNESLVSYSSCLIVL
jgi:Mg-chelatase subunit ChlD